MKKRILSLVLAIALLVTMLPTTAFAANSSHPFTDVSESDWFSDAVQYVYQNGLMNGTEKIIFSPYSTITRGMFVTLLYRLEGEPVISEPCPFDDVTSGLYYEDPVTWAAGNQIVNGVGGASFAPENPLRRQDFATILYRYSGSKGYDVTAQADLDGYTDASSISSYALEAMAWVNAMGIITGNTATTLNPGGYTTRAESAVIFMRFCNNVLPGTESKPTSPSNPSKKSEAEEYFESHSELKDIIDVEKSDAVLTEAQAKSVLEDLGFGQKRDGDGNLVGYPVIYAYSIKGDYTDETEVSAGSTNRHPTYQTFYVSENGEGWVIDVINGEIFANPVSFNLESDMDVMFLVSTTETLTSYDDATNKFYVTIPYASEIFVETVDRIDAETLDRLTVKEICRLTGATLLASTNENVDSNEPVAAFSFNSSYPSYMASAGAGAASDDSIIIVSLGDSYSSGEGIPPFIDQNLSWPEKARSYDFLAHRSENAWPKKLKELLEEDGKNVELHFVAASGAKTVHFFSRQPKAVCKIENLSVILYPGMELPKQLDVFDSINGEDVDYVTLTIGGNDVDFAGIVMLAATNCAYLYFGFTSALEDKLDEIWDNIGVTMKGIERVYRAIEAKAPNAAIIVAGYPKLFAVWGRGLKGLAINELEAAMINTKVTAFNEKIKALVGECQTSGINIHFVDVESAFSGHEAYSRDAQNKNDAWINPIQIPPDLGGDLDDAAIASAYSVHPNAEGAEAYANCVYDKIKEIEESKKVTSGIMICDVYDLAEYQGKKVGTATMKILSDKEAVFSMKFSVDNWEGVSSFYNDYRIDFGGNWVNDETPLFSTGYTTFHPWDADSPDEYTSNGIHYLPNDYGYGSKSNYYREPFQCSDLKEDYINQEASWKITISNAVDFSFYDLEGETMSAEASFISM